MTQELFPIRAKRKWLVMLYFACDDRLPGRRSDEADLKAVVEQLHFHFIKQGLFSNPHIHLVMCLDGLGDTQNPFTAFFSLGQDDETEKDVRDEITRFIVPEAFDNINTPELRDGRFKLDTGSGAVLSRFIDFACDKHPAEHRMLSIISHGGGWSPNFGGPVQPGGHPDTQPGAGGLRGMPIDFNTGSSLSTRELTEALKDGLSGLDRSFQKLDVLFFDACLMGMIECAYAVRDQAAFLIAGENLLWAELPYKKYLDPKKLNDTTLPAQLVEHIVTSYDVGLDIGPFTIAGLNLSRVGDLTEKVGRLAKALLKSIRGGANSDDNRTKIREAYRQAQMFDNNGDGFISHIEACVDLLDFAEKLKRTLPQVGAEAEAVISLIGRRPGSSSEQVVVAKADKPGKGPAQPSGERQHWDFKRAHGVSIYLPLGDENLFFELMLKPTSDATPERRINKLQASYYLDGDQLTFTAECPEWVQFISVMLEVGTDSNELSSRKKGAFRTPALLTRHSKPHA